MREKGGDYVMRKPTKKPPKKKARELKDLGPTLPKYTPWLDSDDEEDWRQNRQIYSSDDEPLSPEDEADYRRHCGVDSEAGLQYYNKKNRTNYELVEALDEVVFLHDAIWIHCNFTAKPQMKPNGDKDAQAQLFFAEMHVSHDLPKRLIVVTCRLLKEGKAKASGGCQACGGPRSVVVHPTRFRRGHPAYQALELRPRGRGRRV